MGFIFFVQTGLFNVSGNEKDSGANSLIGSGYDFLGAASSGKRSRNNDSFIASGDIPLVREAKSDAGVAAVPAKDAAPKPALAKACSFATDKQTGNDPAVIFSEIAWMGSVNNANAEWIELASRSDRDVDISGWQIIDQGEQIKIRLGSKARLSRPQPFYLLERTGDDAVSEVKADHIYVGALGNTKEALRLFDAQCRLIDEVSADSNWPAGSAKEHRTMERMQNLQWQTFFGEQNTPGVLGTPRARNSVPTSMPVSSSTASSSSRN